VKRRRVAVRGEIGEKVAMNLSPLDLANAHVRLVPLAPAQREGLRGAGADPAIWRHWPRPAIGAAAFDAQFDWQLEEHAAGRWIIFAVERAGRLVGQTCYLNIRPEHRVVEVGGTWYAPDAQAGPVNPACKLLMLSHAFAQGAERVELKTDAANARSRAAILKLGATFEGVHRRHMVRPDGTYRDTAWFSVIRPEWQDVRARLEARLAAVAGG